MNRQQFNSRQIFTTKDARITVKRKTFANGTETTTLTGYPILWNQTSSDRGGYVVRLAPNSALFAEQVLALWNHDFSRPLAGTVNDTLRILAADNIGVPVEIDLDTNTTAGADAAAYVASKLVGGMSFSMANGFEEFSDDEEGGQRIITVSKFTTDEVTITPIPAFSSTSIAIKPEDDDEAPDQGELDPLPAGTPPVAGGMSRHDASHKLQTIKLQMLKV